MPSLSRGVIEVLKWEPDTIEASFLSYWFVEFFRGKPWDEYLMCSCCKDSDDYGPSHSYGLTEVVTRSLRNCPTCGTELVLFWGEERTMRYLFGNSESDGRVVLCNGEVASWWRGYPVDRDCFYIDVAAVLPDFRRNPGFRVFLEEFRKFLREKHQEGFSRFTTRTHVKAAHVRMIFRWLGFRETKSSEDPERTYWHLDCWGGLPD